MNKQTNESNLSLEQILTLLESLDVNVIIARYTEPYHHPNHWWVKLEVTSDGTEVKCEAKYSSLEETLTKAFAKLSRVISKGLPLARLAGPIEGELQRVSEPKAFVDDIPF